MFHTASEQGRLTWGMEAGTEEIGEALLRYFVDREFGPTDTSEISDLEYEKRLRAKIRLAEEWDERERRL